MVKSIEVRHEELKEWWEGHEDAKDIGRSSIDQFPGNYYETLEVIAKQKKSVDGLGRTGGRGKGTLLSAKRREQSKKF